MKKTLSFLLVSIIVLSIFSASASDLRSWLSEHAGNPQISTTRSFLDTLDEYDVYYTFMGELSNGEEFVTVKNYDTPSRWNP